MILEAQEPGNPKNRSLNPEHPAPRTRKSPDADAPLGSMLAPKNPRRAPSLVRTEEKVVVWERHRQQPSRAKPEALSNGGNEGKWVGYASITTVYIQDVCE